VYVPADIVILIIGVTRAGGALIPNRRWRCIHIDLLGAGELLMAAHRAMSAFAVNAQNFSSCSDQSLMFNQEGKAQVLVTAWKINALCCSLYTEERERGISFPPRAKYFPISLTKAAGKSDWKILATRWQGKSTLFIYGGRGTGTMNGWKIWLEMCRLHCVHPAGDTHTMEAVAKLLTRRANFFIENDTLMQRHAPPNKSYSSRRGCDIAKAWEI
jgi:hypothetical protein